MIYSLEFDARALEELHKLGDTVRRQVEGRSSMVADGMPWGHQESKSALK